MIKRRECNIPLPLNRKKIGYIIDKLAYFESQLNEMDEGLADEIGLEKAIDKLNDMYIAQGKAYPCQKK